MRKNTTFKNGDRVIIRDWDAMEEQYGIDSCDDSINCKFHFVKGMMQYCGMEVTIASVDSDGGVHFNRGDLGFPPYNFSTDMIRHPDDPDALIQCVNVDADDFFSMLS